jgi:uncharacterized repeat protein (TIGR03803 family)
LRSFTFGGRMKKYIMAALLLSAICRDAFAQQYSVLYSFAGPPSDGAAPNSGLISNEGKIYGTTYSGGTHCSPSGCGTVFVAENVLGKVVEAPIYNFCSTGNVATCPDGANPTAGLVADTDGNLYGTAEFGGNPCSVNGLQSCGVVFKLSLSGGTWSETILYRFSGPDGARPTGQLIFDDTGNLYGTTVYGGAYGAGNVFELGLNGGAWTEKTLHDFNYAVGDGAEPYLSGLVFDGVGNLYGTTATGGPINHNCSFDQYYACGTVFELSPNSDGTWTESIIHAFGVDQRFPLSSLVFDKAGNLYGTSDVDGLNDGSAFRLSLKDGAWKDNALLFDGSNGAYPQAALTIDKGTIYGTTSEGGTNDYGVVFQVQGKTLTVLHNFSGSDGAGPISGGPLLNLQGSLYGATWGGGANGWGTIFMLTP